MGRAHFSRDDWRWRAHWNGTPALACRLEWGKTGSTLGKNGERTYRWPDFGTTIKFGVGNVGIDATASGIAATMGLSTAGGITEGRSTFTHGGEHAFMRSLDRKQHACAASTRRTLIKQVERILQRSDDFSLDRLADGGIALLDRRHKSQAGRYQHQQERPFQAASGRSAMRGGRLIRASGKWLHARETAAENILHYP